MKLVLDWLREYCAHVGSADQVAEELTRLGLEVEHIEMLDGDNAVLEAEVTSNRSDWLCHIGVARDLSTLHGVALRLPAATIKESREPVTQLAQVEILDTDLCPRYTARVITGVRVAPSPPWLQQRMEAVGLRPVNNVVDITNYVLFETGQPLHAFDYDKLTGHRIVVRRARDGERITSIDGTKCSLDSSMLVIADEERPVAVAGVMGGSDTEVGEQTTSILLESACFAAGSVKQTSRKLGLISDSSFRFERGIDPGMLEFASRRAASLIQELAGGTVAGGIVEVNVRKLEPVEIKLRLGRIRRLLGHAVPAERAKRILEGLGFTLTDQTDESITVLVPGHRVGDVSRECDLIEELARIEGYDKVQTTSRMPVMIGHLPRRACFENALADVLTAAGYFETISLSFVQQKNTERLTPWASDGTLLVPNAMNQEENALRKTLLPSLLVVKRHNAYRNVAQVRLFEVSRVFLPMKGEKLPDEKSSLGLYDDDGFRRLKGTVEFLLDSFGVDDVEEKACDLPAVDVAEAVRYEVGGRLLGYLGHLHPSVKHEFDITTSPAVGEFDLDLWDELASPRRKYRKLPLFPSVVHDLAIVVDEKVLWGDVRNAVRRAGSKELVAVTFFDEYRGKQVRKGQKSLAFSLTFRSEKRTLTNEEVQLSVQGILAALRSEFDARLRE